MILIYQRMHNPMGNKTPEEKGPKGREKKRETSGNPKRMGRVEKTGLNTQFGGWEKKT